MSRLYEHIHGDRDTTSGPTPLYCYEQVVAATILRSGGLKQDAQPGQAPAPGWSDAADGQP